MDEILRRAGGKGSELSPELLERIGRSMGPVTAVRPLAAPWVLAGGLVLACVAIAAAVAAGLGMYGIQRLGGVERAVIFPVLGGLLWLSAAVAVSHSIPGSRRRVGPAALVAGGTLVLLAVFAILFHDYGTVRFVPGGVACLRAGLITAIPAGAAIWLILRKGFAVNPAAAGLVAGALAGLTGATMLELHCPNFEVLHVMLWHTAVVPIAGGAGAWIARRVSGK